MRTFFIFPWLAALCEAVFGDTMLAYARPGTRLRGHLAGYDPSAAPRFKWPGRLSKAKREIHQKAIKRGKGKE